MASAPTARATHTDWTTIALLAAMYTLFIGNFVVFQLAPGPLWLHVLLSTAAIHISFTIWHEAVHKNASSRRWVCDAIGVLGIFPYMAPYYVEAWFHLQHHTLLNQDDDPNRIYTDGPFWQIGFRYLRILKYARDRMAKDPRTRGEKVADAVPVALIVALYALAFANGMLLDVVLLWFVPLVFSKVLMDWYINYLPHVGLPAQRFGGTRIIDLAWFTPFVLGHNYHAIHHLWPDVPWHRYRSVFREKLDYLREHGVPIERRLLGYGPAARD